MMRRNIPSMNALTAFEAAARHGNFTRAAQELALTESAVSRQIRVLEEQLGLHLFTRTKKRVVLTSAGEIYGRQVKEILAQIERETLSLMAHRGTEGSLELAVLPTFASEWLIPRMTRFRRVMPDLTVSMGARTKMFMFEETSFDAAIHFGQPIWPGTRAHYLFREHLVPVCRPDMVKKSRAGDDPAVLLKHDLLHSSTRPTDWLKWFNLVGVDDAHEHAMKGARFELHSMVISAVLAGQGVALLPKFLVAGALEVGRLVVAVDREIESSEAYYLVYPERKEGSSRLRCFKEWLLEEALLFRQNVSECSDRFLTEQAGQAI